MRILGLHTTSQGCHAALLEGERVLTATAPQASSALPAQALELARGAGGAIADLGALAIACGPGSFTGIKIGLASAWGLARPHGLRVVGVGSLDALAAAGRRQAGGPLEGPWLAIAGAYAGFVYAARFHGGAAPEDLTLDGDYQVGRPAELIPALSVGARIVLEGTALTDPAAALLESASLESCKVLPGAAYAEAVARIARYRDAKGLRQEPRALYLRADPAKAW